MIIKSSCKYSKNVKKSLFFCNSVIFELKPLFIRLDEFFNFVIWKNKEIRNLYALI